jgi:DNA polymerase III subunit gamma/tau
MNYTVIARRWRPKRLEDVVGQSHIVTTVKNSIKFGRIPHAYLFTGPRGVGKTSLARIIAKAVNCVDGPKEEPCGTCENCLAIDSGSFVDVVEIDAASTRGIDDIRELTETVRYMPMKGRYKLYILDEAHMLTPQARDAFLKTLEEPPGNNIFILATTEPQKIPYTIMSRCQRFDFRRISEKDIVEQMKKICQGDGIEYDEGAFRYIAVEADGSMRDAQSILDQIIAYSGKHISEKDVINVIGVVEKDVLYRIVKSILDGDMKSGLATIERVLDEGYDAYNLYEGLVSYFRNILLVKVYEAIPPFIYMGEEEYGNIAEMLKDTEYYEIQNMLNYLLKAEDLMKGFFPRISLETIYINLYNLSKLRDVDRVLDNLSQGRHSEQTERSVPEDRREPQKRLGHQESRETQERHGHDERREHFDPTPEHSQSGSGCADHTGHGGDARDFIEFLSKKKPFIGSIFKNLDLQIDEEKITVAIDKNYTFIKDDLNLREEVRQHMKQFFGRDMGLVFKDADAKRENGLEDYVREAESLFKV